MIYKILQLTSTTNSVNFWTFVKVDSTSTTDFSSTVLDDVEIKLKELMQTLPITKLKVISEISFTEDLVFS